MVVEDKIIIGIDVGGTKIMTGAINAKGEVICEPIKIATESKEPPEMIVKRITDSVEQLLDKMNADIDDVLGIGIGTTGPVDIQEGRILECPQLPTLHFYPLRKKVQDYFKLPVLFNNDANCLIYGESLFGIGSEKSNIIGFTLGTGIGCAVILNKKLLNGATGTAGEVWISPYRNGTIEDFVSGDGVAKMYKARTGQAKSSFDVFKLADQGEEYALETWKEFGEHLAVAIAWSINLIDPELVILGGSIANAFKFFEPEMEKKLRKNICSAPSEKTKVVLAKLGDHAGFIGAACLVLENNR